jgi:hypothetical protein
LRAAWTKVGGAALAGAVVTLFGMLKLGRETGPTPLLGVLVGVLTGALLFAAATAAIVFLGPSLSSAERIDGDSANEI